MYFLGAWALAGGMLHYKEGSGHGTSMDSTVLFEHAPANSLLNNVFCYVIHHLPKFPNMHQYRFTHDTDIVW